MKISRLFTAAGLSAMTYFATLHTAHATIATFTDRASFLATTGATDATGPLPEVGLGATTTLAIGSVTIFAPRWVIEESTLTLPGNDLSISYGAGDVGGLYNDGIDTTFASPVYSAGFDFMEPSVSFTADGTGCSDVACVDSTYLVTLKNGASPVGSFTFNAPDDVAAFVGVWSNQAFTKLEIRETVGAADDELYGHFYTGTVPLNPVPEPTTSLLLGAGLAGLAVWRRRRSAQRENGEAAINSLCSPL